MPDTLLHCINSTVVEQFFIQSELQGLIPLSPIACLDVISDAVTRTTTDF